MNKVNELCIVGFGPRGLYALECYLMTLSRKRNQHKPKVTILESQSQLGVGSAWHTDQPDVNWINIADRALKPFPDRPEIKTTHLYVPEFSGFMEWTSKRYNHEVSEINDTFFSRKIMGIYLNERALSLKNALQSIGTIQFINDRVQHVEINNALASISTQDHKFLAHHVMLTIGHLATIWSPQDKEWTEHSDHKNCSFVREPYTKESYELYKKATAIGIKGLGLSMIDIINIAITDLKGKFEEKSNSIFLNFKSNNSKQIVCVPFSLDGLPPVPKPLGMQVDKKFTPSSAQLTQFENTLIKLVKKEHGELSQILDLIAQLISELYNNYTSQLDKKAVEQLIIKWFNNADLKHELILDKDLEIITYMKQSCSMASDKTESSLDYFIGQVWRHLQPTMYEVISHSALNEEIQANFIALDERMKRYAYGPPVERVLQLIALEKAGILNLAFVNDPDINLIDNGWELKTNNQSTIVGTMVNGVLASPDLKKIDDNLINSMHRENYFQSFKNDLGIETNESGNILNGTSVNTQIAVLGRNAKGSEYGVDAILECFSSKTQRWATDLIERSEIVN